MRLNEVQKRFKDTMLDHPKVLDNPPADFAALFNEGDIPLSARLKVYRNNIVGSLTDVMIASHPLLEKLVGHDFLKMMAGSFILENPPAHGCLNMYGEGFDKFIESCELAKALPYLPDMARLEIAMNKAYHATEDEALSAKELGSVPPEELRLKPRQNVHLVSSGYPVDEIRDFCIEDDPDKTMSVDTGGVKLMVYRPGLEVKIIKLMDDEYDMLSYLTGNLPLNEALETTMNAYEHFDFERFLQRHIELETFLSLHANT